MNEQELDADIARLQQKIASKQGQAPAPVQAAPVSKPVDQMSEEDLDADIKRLQAKLGITSEGLGGEKKVLNESAGLSGRFRVKNFGGDIEDQISYLRSLPENKDFEIDQYNDEIVAKKKGEKEWKKLDPTGFTNIKELAQDVTDSAYDVASGIGTAAATGLAAVPGAIFGAGVGGLGTAAAASGASSALFEGIRQKIGQLGGVRKDMNLVDVGVAGLLGGVTTGVLGAGVGKATLEKALSKPEVVKKALGSVMTSIPESMTAEAQKEMAQNIIMDSQKGLLSRSIGSKVGKILTGIDDKLINRTTQKAPQSLVDDFAERVGVDPNRKYTFLELNDEIKKSGVSGVADSAIERTKGAVELWRKDLSDELDQAIKTAKGTGDLNKYVGPIEDLINELQDSYNKSGLKKYQRELEEARKAASLFEKAPEPNQVFFDLETGLSGIEQRALTRAPGKENLLPISDVYSLKNTITDQISYDKGQLKIKDMPIISQRVRKALMSSNRAMTADIDKALGENAVLRQKWGQMRKIQEIIEPRFKDQQTALSTVENMDAARNRVLKETLDQIPKEYTGGVSLTDLSDLAAINKVFGNPTLGLKEVANAARAIPIGSGLGYLGGIATGIPGAGAAGAAAGGILGGLAASPAAVKQGLQAQTAVTRGLESVAGGVGSAIRADKIREQLQRIQARTPELLQPSLTGPGAVQMIQQTGAIPGAWDLLWKSRGEQ